MHQFRTFAAATGLAIALWAVAPMSWAQGPPGAGEVPGGGQGGGVMGTGGQAGGMMGMGGQGGGMMGMGGQSSPVMILLAPSVQKELKLSEEQKSKVYSLAKTSGQKGRDLAQQMSFGAGNANPQGMMEAAANPQGMMEAARKLRQEADQSLAGILDAKQKERLDQIVLQAEGPLAVARPEVAAKLRLSDTQKEYVQEIIIQMRNDLIVAMRQGAATGQFNPGQARVMATQLRGGAVQEISKVIDRKQKAAFNKMLGEPFDTSKVESEAASTDPDAASPTDPAKPANTAETKDAPAADAAKEKETTKDTGRPAARKKGRSRAGANR